MGCLKKLKYKILSSITYGKIKLYYKEKYKNIKYNSTEKKIEDIYNRLFNMENHLNNINYELADFFNISNDNIKIPNIMSIDNTIDIIFEKKLSISRFGDGEFRYLLGENDLKKFYFETDFDKNLQKRLQEVILSSEENHLVCLWDFFGELDKFNTYGKNVARMYMPRFRTSLDRYLSYNRVYGNLNITRPYIIFKNKEKSKSYFNKIKQIWDNKDIVIIEGTFSKLGIGNDLFANASSIKRLLCPAQNAWRKYDKILKEALTIQKDKLILIALGMTATILAYDLSKRGYWAIDIGHIDIEYSWFLIGAESPVCIQGKYTNDAIFGGGITSKSIPTYDLPEWKEKIISIIE